VDVLNVVGTSFVPTFNVVPTTYLVRSSHTVSHACDVRNVLPKYILANVVLMTVRLLGWLPDSLTLSVMFLFMLWYTSPVLFAMSVSVCPSMLFCLSPGRSAVDSSFDFSIYVTTHVTR
jgi:hypothetical protein